ncbi:uncharacterized protein LOC131018075, partial [Salvia miltiorrhiza]|uniref:uncharacterized protein LOC131018075 n=1 Tax=Salvia miltiorrhiza TaxID=226208 RepID=UPI0025AB79FD
VRNVKLGLGVSHSLAPPLCKSREFEISNKISAVRHCRSHRPSHQPLSHPPALHPPHHLTPHPPRRSILPPISASANGLGEALAAAVKSHHREALAAILCCPSPPQRRSQSCRIDFIRRAELQVSPLTYALSGPPKLAFLHSSPTIDRFFSILLHSGLTGLFCPCVLFGRNVTTLNDDIPERSACIGHAVCIEGGIALAIATAACNGIDPDTACLLTEGLLFAWWVCGIYTGMGRQLLQRKYHLKVDLLLESGEYFLSDQTNQTKKWQEKQEKQAAKVTETKRKREEAFL